MFLWQGHFHTSVSALGTNPAYIRDLVAFKLRDDVPIDSLEFEWRFSHPKAIPILSFPGIGHQVIVWGPSKRLKKFSYLDKEGKETNLLGDKIATSP